MLLPFPGIKHPVYLQDFIFLNYFILQEKIINHKMTLSCLQCVVTSSDVLVLKQAGFKISGSG